MNQSGYMIFPKFRSFNKQEARGFQRDCVPAQAVGIKDPAAAHQSG